MIVDDIEQINLTSLLVAMLVHVYVFTAYVAFKAAHTVQREYPHYDSGHKLLGLL